jgi:hypothetical protein
LFGFSRIFLLEILIFKGLTARRHYKSFGVKGVRVINMAVGTNAEILELSMISSAEV